MASDARGISGWIKRLINGFITWFFDYSEEGAQRRILLAFIVLGFLTLMLALFADRLVELLLTVLRTVFAPGTPAPAPTGVSLFQRMIENVSSPQFLRHVLVLVIATWIPFRVAAFYVNDIFELDDFKIGVRFVRQSAFFPRARTHESTMVIANGDVDPRYKKSTIASIGGPGTADVHMENVALFERVGGIPHVIGPTQRSLQLEGFERLRKIIDLRDQVLDLTVEGRTQDGIKVIAKDVKLVFSIYRGGESDNMTVNRAVPYPYSSKAVENLVYGQGPGHWYAAMQSLIEGELRSFISQHRLEEFLSNVDGSAGGFTSRDQLTDLFTDFTKEFSKRAEERGVQLQWIGVGTWVVPNEIIPSRHLDAWRISSDARLRGNENALRKSFKEARTGEFLRLLDEAPSVFYNNQDQNLPDRELALKLALVYLEKLRNAIELYGEKNEPVPHEVDIAHRQLRRVGTRMLDSDYPPDATTRARSYR